MFQKTSSNNRRSPLVGKGSEIYKCLHTNEINHEKAVGAAASRTAHGDAVGEPGGGQEAAEGALPRKVAGVRQRISEGIYCFITSTPSNDGGKNQSKNRRKHEDACMAKQSRHGWSFGISKAKTTNY